MQDHLARDEKMLGAILRRARKKAGLTQSELGARVGLRQATVSRVEAGEPAVQIDTMMAMLSALDLELVVRSRTRGSPDDIADLF